MASSDTVTTEPELKESEGVNYWRREGMAEGGVIKEVRSLTPASKLIKGIKIVDCDTHITEAPDLWTSRAPDTMKDKMPQVRRINGQDTWIIGDLIAGYNGGGVILPNGDKVLGKLGSANRDLMHEGSWKMKPRVAFMDKMGIYAQIAYQNSSVTQVGVLKKLNDDALAVQIMKSYNDAAADNQRESGNRIFPQAMLPVWDRDATIAEARRCIEELGLKGFVMPDRPEQWGIPGFMDPYWEPFFELCNHYKVPINFHLSSGIDGFDFAWKEFSFEQKLAVASMLFYLGNAATLANFICSGIFDKYPNLRVVSVESGAGWVPFVLESLEYQFDEMMPREAAKLNKRPTEYFRDNIWVTYWFESEAPKRMLDLIGEDKLLFETDFPHPTSLYPEMHEKIEETLGGHPFAVRKKILQSNAAHVYNLDI